MLAGGRIVATGGPELADELEQTGYAAYGADPVGAAAANGHSAKPVRPKIDDPFMNLSGP